MHEERSRYMSFGSCTRRTGMRIVYNVGAKEDPTTPLGWAIRRARDAAGLTDDALGALIHKDQTTLSKWQLGRSVPSLNDIRAIEDALELERGALLWDAGYVSELGELYAVIQQADVQERTRSSLLQILKLDRDSRGAADGRVPAGG